MPSFCLSCWPSTPVFHSADAQKKPTGESRPAQKIARLEKPTPTEYAGEATKQFLEVLGAVADQIPLPGVSMTVKIARNIIQACDDSHATLERAEELKLRIRTLVTILVDELKTKKAEEIQEKLQEDIKSLSSDLQYIKEKLDEIASQHALLVIFFRSVNEDKVRRCISRLNNALESFGVVRQIQDAKVLNSLEQRILAFHASYQKALEHIQITMDDVKAILQERLPMSSSSLRTHSRSAVPASPGIFHGRDDLVVDLVSALTSGPDSHHKDWVCLLGPGGMGKTSTSLAVMAHPDLTKRFPAKNQVWVPCVKATSISLFLDTLYSSMGTMQNTGHVLKDILSELKSSSQPLIVLLDNFETPWNIDGGRSEVEQVLYDLHQIPHVTVFITMRSSVPPGIGIHWHSVSLQAVDEDAAHQIYCDVCPDSSNDAKLRDLLCVLGNMPLAITLMATLGKTTALDAEQLMDQYGQHGNAILEQGQDAKHSMEICISLSVDSPPMKNHPEAFDLLATLVMLPTGTTYGALVKWWARNNPNLAVALKVLRETALIEIRGTTYYVLPVIRSYILGPSRFPSKVRDSVIESACNFLQQHKSSPGDPSFLTHAAALSSEESNLQAILLDTAIPQNSLIEALLVLARYQASTRARLEVIEHTLKLARQMENQALLAEAQECYGWMLYYLGRDEDALDQFDLAHQAFTSNNDTKRAAKCLLNKVEVLQFSDYDFDTNSELIQTAKTVFDKFEDKPGIALSLRYLGRMQGQEGLYKQGIESLTRARDMFHASNDPLNHAHCSYNISEVYFWDSDWANAQLSGRAAVHEYESLGQYTGDATRYVGQILLATGDYAGALNMLVDSVRSSKSFGRLLELAQSLEVMGYTWAKMFKTADAQKAYDEAMEIYGKCPSTLVAEDGLIRCRFLVRRLTDPTLVPDEDECEAIDGLYYPMSYPIF